MDTGILQRTTVAHALLPLSIIFFFSPCITHEIDQPSINATRPTSLEHHMRNLAEQQRFLPQTRVAKSTCVPLRLTTVITGLLLSIMLLLTGCGDGGETASNPGDTMTPGSVGATVSLTWDPVLGSSVSAYFVYYGKQSPNQSGSCVYERSISVDSSSATVSNLDPNTLYYFSISAYNGRESPCSEEVSTVTPSASA